MGITEQAVRATAAAAGAALSLGSVAARSTMGLAGAVGGAAVGGTVGTVGGALSGAGLGAARGARSQPAAALTLAGLGVAGVVEWPLLLAVGGTALLIRQLDQPSARRPARVRSAA